MLARPHSSPLARLDVFHLHRGGADEHLLSRGALPSQCLKPVVGRPHRHLEQFRPTWPAHAHTLRHYWAAQGCIGRQQPVQD